MDDSNKKILAVVVLAVSAAAAYGIYGRGPAAPETKPGLSSPPPAAPAPVDPALPALEGSDPFFREAAARLTDSPVFKRWLALENLIPRIAAALNRAAEGEVARDTFAAFKPRGKFKVRKIEGRTVADPASYARYDELTAMIQSVDAVAAARLYERLYPLFDAAQANLGESARPRELFLAAAKPLLSTPVPTGEPDLMEGKKGIGWVYTDENLEALTPAQKQLLRLGPKNQAIVQAKLRAIALALGGL